jgi:energy-converting hydrogenase Eha subunit A
MSLIGRLCSGVQILVMCTMVTNTKRRVDALDIVIIAYLLIHIPIALCIDLQSIAAPGYVRSSYREYATSAVYPTMIIANVAELQAVSTVLVESLEMVHDDI